MAHYIITAIVLIYIILTAFLEAWSETRIVPADIVIIFLTIIISVKAILSKRIFISKAHIAIIPLVFVFIIGAFFSNHPDRAIIELLAILVGLVASITISNYFVKLSNQRIEVFSKLYLIVLSAFALICILDFLVIPNLISSRNLGGLQGPFRNTGQAGSFFGVHIAISSALLLSGIIPRKLLYLLGISLLIFALVLTFKRAALAGFILGLLFLSATTIFSNSKRDKKISISLLLGLFIITPIGVILFQWGIDNVPKMLARFEKKFNNDTVESFSNGFFADNINSALAAFSDSPIFGVGLGNVNEVYQYHEIHSSYLGIVAYGGILGTLGYIFFMWVLLSQLKSNTKKQLKNRYSSFLYYLFPLVLGLMISWVYTIHLRKREFWILFAFIIAFQKLSRLNKNNTYLKDKE